MKKVNFFRDEFIVLILLFLIIGTFSIIPFNQTIFNPISTALADFDINDIIYSKLHNQLLPDSNIVIANISNLDREEIAGILNRINKFKPKVVGIDAVFSVEKDYKEDYPLMEALNRIENLVLVNRLSDYNENKDVYNKESGSCLKFSKNAEIGFANFSYENNSLRTVRVIKPSAVCKTKLHFSFSARVAELYNKSSFSALMERRNDVENINFTGNLNKFYFLDVNDLKDTNYTLNVVRDKIVLVGYTGIDRYTRTFEDIFFTPLNERYAGKTFPDMYGVVIHANIISMFLSGNYINVFPLWIVILLAVIIAYFNIAFYLSLKRKYKDWFSLISKLVILIQTIIFILTGILLFNYLSYKINTTVIIASIILVPIASDIYLTYLQTFLKKLKRQPGVTK